MEMNEKVRNVPEHQIRTKLFVVATTMVLLGAVFAAVAMGMFGGLPVRAIVAADSVLPITNITIKSPTVWNVSATHWWANSTSWSHTAWYLTNVTLNFTAYDPALVAGKHAKLNWTDYRVNGGKWTNYTNATVHLLSIELNQSVVAAGGNVTVEARSMDNNGDRNSTKITLWIDTAAPVVSTTLVTGTAGTNGWYKSASVSVKLAVVDKNGSGINTTYWKNGTAAIAKANATTALPTFLMIGEGTHALTACAKDNATNNGTMKDLAIKIDSVAPTLNMTNASGTISVNKSTLSWTASDATSGIDHYEVKVGSGAFVAVGTVLSYQVTGLADGNNTVIVKAVDKAGNSVEKTIYLTVNKPAGTDMTLIIVILVVIIVIVIVAVMMMKRKGKSPVDVAAAAPEEEKPSN
jgi:hypothetical protein